LQPCVPRSSRLAQRIARVVKPSQPRLSARPVARRQPSVSDPSRWAAALPRFHWRHASCRRPQVARALRVIRAGRAPSTRRAALGGEAVGAPAAEAACPKSRKHARARTTRWSALAPRARAFASAARRKSSRSWVALIAPCLPSVQGRSISRICSGYAGSRTDVSSRSQPSLSSSSRQPLMKWTSSRWLMAPAAMVLLGACGGHVGAALGDGGSAEEASALASGSNHGSPTSSATPPSGGSPPVGSLPSGSSVPPSSSGAPASLSLGGSATHGSGPSTGGPISGTPGDASCPATSWQPTPGFSACWNCIWGGCSTQLEACANDCACSQSVSQAIACTGSGGSSFQCFAPLAPLQSGPLMGAEMCLSFALGECPACQTGFSTPPIPSASSCTKLGTANGGGSGTCITTVSEKCGDTSYQVVCACPQATCACMGPTNKVLPFASCPNCPAPSPGTTASGDLFALCGFPH
jgi:hypothetical protein